MNVCLTKNNVGIPSLLRAFVWLIFNILLIFLIYSFENLSEGIKLVFAIGLILQVIFYLLLAFLDAGTLFEDEEENMDEERIFCMVCSVYRLRTTKHCVFCNRCIQKYDHHCGVFGKCIGKRNIILFWAFITLVGVELPSLIILICINYVLKVPKWSYCFYFH